MARLFAFGCSYTYGYGLEDCYLDTNFGPSKLAWPNLVASELSIECINKGVTAASNTKILMEMLDTNFEKDDIIIVVWSYTHRGLLFESADSSLNMLPPFHHPLKKPYYQIHNNYDLLVKSILDIHHANAFLNNKGIKVYNFYIDQTLHNLDECRYLSLLKDIKLIWINLRNYKMDLAKDNSHPGPLSQKELSKFILDIVKKDNLNSLLSNSSIV
jgi:hypothetical protein